MGLFVTRAKNDPPDVERRLYTMFLVKHKKKNPDFSSFEQQKSQQPQPTQQEEERNFNQPLGQERMDK